ncbi:MAG: phosphotransferase [Polyangiaceae bacterium]|nr:phosphotransferase [Polyangiaceae bacterium]
MSTLPPAAVRDPAPSLPALERLVREATGASGPVRIDAMEGGASTRRFYRIDLGNGRTAVAMFVPDAKRSDEVAKADDAERRWPFLEVRDLLADKGVRVPEVLGEACDDGFLLVEDLGDDTLARYLEKNPETRERLYQTAVADLARAQRALAPLPASSVVASRAFDEDLLRWEVDHFREWALEARGITLSEGDRATFAEAASTLAQRIAAWPRGFVHRDYQSRNLMVRERASADPTLVWIDFQDALLGPRVYDLVALLNDSYQSFDRAFVEARLDEYAEHHQLDALGRQAVGREFDTVTVQRKLKDAGRFVFIDRVRGNPGFLGFVEPTIEKVFGALGRLEGDPVLDRLHAMLRRLL